MTQIERLVPGVGQFRAVGSEYAWIHRSRAWHRFQLIWIEIGAGSDGG
jgi:hypothetical protein